MSDDLQAKIDEISARYQPELDRIEEEGRKLGDEAMDPSAAEAVITVDFDLDWQDKEIVFNIPTVTMRQRDLSLHLPTVRSDRQRIVFDTPSIRMERRCVAKYPKVIRWNKIKMVCAYAHMPVTFMERQEIIYDLPAVVMERRDFSMKVPEFGMKEQRWVLRLPQITVKSIKAEARRLEEKGQELQRRGEELAKRMADEVQLLIAGGSSAATSAVNGMRDQVLQAYAEAIAELEKAIAGMIAAKVDPIKVPAEGGEINLRKQLAELMAERDRVEAELADVFSPTDDDMEEEGTAAPVAA